MKQHYIVIASMQCKIIKPIKEYIEECVLSFYHCSILKKDKFNSIFELWDLLDDLSLQQQANTLVVFDPGIYESIPKEVSNRPNKTNYWHKVNTEELFPWYELVLRYPLVTPLFLTFDKALFGDVEVDPFCYLNLKNDPRKQLQENVSLFLSGFRTWFDPFGLRDGWRHKVLEKIFKPLESNDSTPQSKRVFCVEDEMDYALLNSYTAYKYGANVWLIESYKTLPWAEEKATNSNIVIRDRDLRFRDFRGDENRNRESLMEDKGIFNKVDTEIFVSSYVKNSDDNTIAKPVESIYEVAKRCKLEYKRTLKPRYPAGGEGNHSSPYLNMQLALHLIDTAQKSGDTIADKVFRALHYTEAYMILNYMAETTSMEILKKIHISELDITLSFMGISKNQSISNRKKDIEEDIDKLLDKEKEKMKESFLISFWNSAKKIYLNHEQFLASEDANLETMKFLPWR